MPYNIWPVWILDFLPWGRGNHISGGKFDAFFLVFGVFLGDLRFWGIPPADSYIWHRLQTRESLKHVSHQCSALFVIALWCRSPLFAHTILAAVFFSQLFAHVMRWHVLRYNHSSCQAAVCLFVFRVCVFIFHYDPHSTVILAHVPSWSTEHNYIIASQTIMHDYGGVRRREFHSLTRSGTLLACGNTLS